MALRPASQPAGLVEKVGHGPLSHLCVTGSSSLLLQVTELENLPQDVSRSAYTQRILEIVSNIKKQKEEITKVKK